MIGGAVYGGWRWTQTQYYVGVNGEHVAVYRGISQDLAWVSLSKVQQDHPEIELKYLPPYQQKQVKNTIVVAGGLSQARSKVQALSVQASACRKEAERTAAAREQQNSKTGQGATGGTTGATKTAFTKASPSPDPSASGSKSPASPSKSPTASATPRPGPSLSEDEQKVADQCGKQ